MSNRVTVHNRMRIWHRYLGFFLAGIMAVYAISGVIMIFRDTGFLKKTVAEHKTLRPGLSASELGQELRIRDLAFIKAEGPVQTFKTGTYNSQTGEADHTLKKYPVVIEKLTHLHKASTKEPLFYLNAFFGSSLLFFVLSSFWMFLPRTSIFKKGLWFALAGLALTLLMLFW